MDRLAMIVDVVKRGQTKELVELLKGEKNTSLDFIDPNQEAMKWTCLHWAASAGHSSVCTVLLQHGASVDLPDRNGETALHQAAWRGHADCVRVLLHHNAAKGTTNKDGRKPFDLATHPQVKSLLVEQDEWVNEEDDSD